MYVQFKIMNIKNASSWSIKRVLLWMTHSDRFCEQPIHCSFRKNESFTNLCFFSREGARNSLQDISFYVLHRRTDAIRIWNICRWVNNERLFRSFFSLRSEKERHANTTMYKYFFVIWTNGLNDLYTCWMIETRILMLNDQTWALMIKLKTGDRTHIVTYVAGDYWLSNVTGRKLSAILIS